MTDVAVRLACLETLGDFVSAILSGGRNEMSFCIREAGRRGFAVDLFERLATVPRPPIAKRVEFHSAWIVEGFRIRRNMATDEPLLDALVNMLPGYTGPAVELFRGEQVINRAARTYGPSWTAERRVAQMYGADINCCPVLGGLLLRTVASAIAILAAPNNHSRFLGEYEYVVDRRKLSEIQMIEKYPPDAARKRGSNRAAYAFHC